MDGRDVTTDVVVLGARGKVLVMSHTDDGFSVIVLDKADFERLAAERPHFTAKTISAATQKARQAVESEKTASAQRPQNLNHLD